MSRSTVVRRLQVYATPARAGFQCTACGNCCHGWSVSVDRATYDRLGKLLVPCDENPKNHAVDRSLTVAPEPIESAYATLNMKDGHCVFLDDDQLCYLHRHFGEASKPVTCRRFPSTTVATPQGRFLHPTFACQGMAISLGRHVGDFSVVREAPHLKETAAQISVSLTRNSLIHFGPARAEGGVTSMGMDELMRGLRSIMKIEGVSTEALLLAGRLWLEELSETHLAFDEKDVQKSRERALKDGGATLLARAAQMPKSPELHMSTLRLIIARRFLDLGGMIRVSQEWFEDVVKRYPLDAPLQASAEAFQRDLATTYLPAQPALRALLRTYAAEKLYYHPNYLSYGFVAGYHSVLYLFVLIRMFAVGHAAQQGLALDTALVLDAIQIVEREFDHTENLFAFWQDATHVETLKPLFASVLLGT